MGASGASLDVKLCSAWPLVPDNGVLGGVAHLGNENVFPYRTIRLVRIIFAMMHQGNEALSGCAQLLDPPLPMRTIGTIDP